MAGIKDVAKRAGVSITTVSMILNNKSNRHNNETILRVRKAARELGYQPNYRAKALRMDKSLMIGLIVPDISNPYYPEIAKEISDRLSEKGYSLMLLNSNESISEEEKFLKRLKAKWMDGLILFSRNIPVLEEKGYFNGNANIVLVDDVDYIGLNYSSVVMTDNLKGGYLLGKHLLKMGHRNIGFVGGYPSSIVTKNRLKGVQLALNEKDLEIADQNIYCQNFDLHCADNALNVLNWEKLTAIVCVNDIIAHRLINCVQKLGRQVPRDLSVVGYDYLSINQYMAHDLTTIKHFPDRLAARTVELITDSVKGKYTEGLFLVNPELHIGNTVQKVGD